MLQQALEIRQSIGDKKGMAVTQHNLKILAKPPLPPKSQGRGGTGRWFSKGTMSLVILTAMAALTTATVFAVDRNKLPPAISQIINPIVGSASTRAPLPSANSTETFIPTDTSIATTPALIIPNTGATQTQMQTLTATPTLTSTQTQTITPTNTSIPQAQVSFTADSTNINFGQCTFLHWKAQFATAVLLDGAEVASVDQRQVCPQTKTTYRLHVEALSGNIDQSIVIRVTPPTPTFTTVPQDKTGPDVFNYQEKPDPSFYGSTAPGDSMTTFGAMVSDPSGIAKVQFLYSYNDGKSWNSIKGSDLGGGYYSATIDNNAGNQAYNTLGGATGKIIWYVIATDTFGNDSISGYQSASIQYWPG